jgi:hypothetical protein
MFLGRDFFGLTEYTSRRTGKAYRLSYDYEPDAYHVSYAGGAGRLHLFAPTRQKALELIELTDQSG